MKYSKIILIASCGMMITSCDIILSSGTYIDNPGGVGGPEVSEDGKFKDSDANWDRFERNVKMRIHNEKFNLIPNFDWQGSWRISFDSYNRASENPERKKQYVIKKRREAGLPIWPFMLR